MSVAGKRHAEVATRSVQRNRNLAWRSVVEPFAWAQSGPFVGSIGAGSPPSSFHKSGPCAAAVLNSRRGGFTRILGPDAAVPP